MQTYQAGDVYFYSFPQLDQIPNTKDFNIDSRKPNATPRPAIILDQVDANRIIIAPVSSDGSQNHLTFGTFVPIRSAVYPSFLKADSFVKTNQIQVVSTKRLYPMGDTPIKAGELKPVDLDRVRLYSLYATQTEKSYSDWIGEIVAKNVKLRPHEVSNQVYKSLGLPERPTSSSKFAFERGDVYICQYQPEAGGIDTGRLTGAHRSILVTDAKAMHMPPGQAYVVPVLPNKPENINYFSPHDVLLGEERACVSQIQPMNRDWINEKSAKLSPSQLIEVDRGVIAALGLRDHVIERARNVIQQQVSRSKAR